MFLNLKSKHIIKGVIPQIENEQDKLTCESIASENFNIIKKRKLNRNKNFWVKKVLPHVTQSPFAKILLVKNCRFIIRSVI